MGSIVSRFAADRRIGVVGGVVLSMLALSANAQTPAVIDYTSLYTPVLNTLPAMFAGVVAVFTAVLVPKFALRLGKFAIRRLSGIAGGH